MKALFIQHDHVSPTGPVSDRLRHHGYEIDEMVVVPEESFRDPNVKFALSEPVLLKLSPESVRAPEFRIVKIRTQLLPTITGP